MNNRRMKELQMLLDNADDVYYEVFMKKTDEELDKAIEDAFRENQIARNLDNIEKISDTRNRMNLLQAIKEYKMHLNDYKKQKEQEKRGETPDQDDPGGYSVL